LDVDLRLLRAPSAEVQTERLAQIQRVIDKKAELDAIPGVVYCLPLYRRMQVAAYDYNFPMKPRGIVVKVQRDALANKEQIAAQVREILECPDLKVKINTHGHPVIHRLHL
jgi:hypothetical protein